MPTLLSSNVSIISLSNPPIFRNSFDDWDYVMLWVHYAPLSTHSSCLVRYVCCLVLKYKSILLHVVVCPVTQQITEAVISAMECKTTFLPQSVLAFAYTEIKLVCAEIFRAYT